MINQFLRCSLNFWKMKKKWLRVFCPLHLKVCKLTKFATTYCLLKAVGTVRCCCCNDSVTLNGHMAWRDATKMLKRESDMNCGSWSHQRPYALVSNLFNCIVFALICLEQNDNHYYCWLVSEGKCEYLRFSELTMVEGTNWRKLPSFSEHILMYSNWVSHISVAVIIVGPNKFGNMRSGEVKKLQAKII